MIESDRGPGTRHCFGVLPHVPEALPIGHEPPPRRQREGEDEGTILGQMLDAQRLIEVGGVGPLIAGVDVPPAGGLGRRQPNAADGDSTERRRAIPTLLPGTGGTKSAPYSRQMFRCWSDRDSMPRRPPPPNLLFACIGGPPNRACYECSTSSIRTRRLDQRTNPRVQVRPKVRCGVRIRVNEAGSASRRTRQPATVLPAFHKPVGNGSDRALESPLVSSPGINRGNLGQNALNAARLPRAARASKYSTCASAASRSRTASATHADSAAESPPARLPLPHAHRVAIQFVVHSWFISKRRNASPGVSTSTPKRLDPAARSRTLCVTIQAAPHATAASSTNSSPGSGKLGRTHTEPRYAGPPDTSSRQVAQIVTCHSQGCQVTRRDGSVLQHQSCRHTNCKQAVPNGAKGRGMHHSRSGERQSEHWCR